MAARRLMRTTRSHQAERSTGPAQSSVAVLEVLQSRPGVFAMRRACARQPTSASILPEHALERRNIADSRPAREVLGLVVTA